MPYDPADAITAGYKQVFDSILSKLDAEQAHSYVLTGLEGVQNYDRMQTAYTDFVDRNSLERDGYVPLLEYVNDALGYEDDRLAQDVFGLKFSNPVGVAAGLDKNARVPDALAALGFGHVEVGGVTAHQQDGNPLPRMHRVEDDNAVINSMGFPNDGSIAVADRLKRYAGDIPVGVNLGESHNVPYITTSALTQDRLQSHADYFTANVSCPNVDDGEDLQEADQLAPVLNALDDANRADDPLLVKLSPDLDQDALHGVLDVAMDYDIDGIIATNTSTDTDLLSGNREYPDGGISGAPITDRSTATVAETFDYTGGELPIIGVGGVSTADDAYEKITAGASLVQLYTGMVYEGPAIARNINNGVAERLERDGHDSIEDAVGAAHT